MGTRRITLALALLSSLLFMVLIPNAHATTVSYHYLQPFSTSYSHVSKPPVVSTGPTRIYSPASSVAQYNNNNAAWYITCPQVPEKSPTNPQYFYTDPASFIAGDQCLANTNQLHSTVDALLSITYNSGGLPSASASVNIIKPATLAINEWAYTPEVNRNVSTAFSTAENIWDTFPLNGQRAIWTWNARYANFANVPPISFTKTLTGLSYSTASCSYTYDYAVTYSLSNFRNSYIPYTEVTWPGSATTSFNTQVLPYLIMKSNVSNLNLVSKALNLSVSYDIYSPWNYYGPTNHEDPFHINTPSLFFAEYHTGTSSSGNCPNQAYTPGSSDALTFAQVVDCAKAAGFSGDQLMIIVSIADKESSFQPGAQLGSNLGLLQMGPGLGGSYDGSKCTTGTDWWWNPLCSMQAAYHYTHDSQAQGGWNGVACPSPVPGHTFCQWQTYEPGSQYFCGDMPTSYSGENCPGGGGGLPWSSVNIGGSLGAGPAEGTNLTAFGRSSDGSGLGFDVNNEQNIISLISAPNVGGGGSSATPSSALASILLGSDAWQVPYIEQASTQTGIPDVIIASVEMQESGGTCYPTTNSAGYGGWFGLSTSDMSKEGQDPNALSGCSPSDFLAQAIASAKFFVPLINQYNGWWEALCSYNGGSPTAQCNNPGNGGSCTPPEVGPDCWYPTHVLDMISKAGASLPCVGPIPSDYPYPWTGSKGGACLGSSSATQPTSGGPGSIGIQADSITAISSDYMYILGTSAGAGGTSGAVSTSGYTYPVSSSCILDHTSSGGPWIDEGVDWAGTSGCQLLAVGSGTILSPLTNSGWNYCGNDAFVVLRLDHPLPPDSVSGGYPRQYIYYAEGFTPTVTAGERVTTGQVIGNMPGGCTEIGWADPTAVGDALAAFLGNGAGATPQGQDFFKFISTLSGAPSGSPSPTPPPPSSSSPAQLVFVAKLLAHGEYNSSILQPNSLTSETDQGTWDSNWGSYWGTVIGLQNGSTYVVNAIYPDVGNILRIKKYAAHTGLTYSGFTAYNVSADSFGTVYLTGSVNFTDTMSDQFSYPFIVRISNTITGNELDRQVTGNFIIDPVEFCHGAVTGCAPQEGSQWLEITASPTGALLYVADPKDHNILAYDANTLDYVGCFDLVFSDTKTCGTINNGCGHGLFSPIEDTIPDLNISSYFLSGGFEGINPRTGTSKAAADLAAILDGNANIGDNNAASGQLDRDCWHYPLGIQDINGYLYVLDNWGARYGQTCSIIIGGVHEGCTGGVKFNMLMLRVINSSGADIQISPTHANDIWIGGDFGTTAIPEPTQKYFPPYGWILAANVTGTDGGVQVCLGGHCSKSDTSLNVCNENTANCTVNAHDAPSSYQPLLPSISNWECTHFLGSCIPFTSHIPNFDGVSFGVGINGTAVVYLPSQPSLNGGTGKAHVANQHGGLAFINFNVENYTKDIGVIGPPFSYPLYKCYVDKKAASTAIGSGSGYGTCRYEPNIDNIWGLVYPADNPFEYTESIGSLRTLTYEDFFYSSFTAGSTAPGGPSKTPTYYQGAFGSTEINKISCSTGHHGPFCHLPSTSSGAAVPVTAINSIVGGYLVVPFSYTYSLTEQITQTNYPGPSCPSISTTSTSGATVYAFANTLWTKSSPLVANIEGGPSYAEYLANQTYYQESIAPSTLPPQIIYQFATDRKLANIYINATFLPSSNHQGIINSTRQLLFNTMTHMQGPYPGYEVIKSKPIVPPCYKPSCAAPYAKTSSTIDKYNNFSYSQTNAPALVSLFNWERFPVYSTIINLDLNGTKNTPKDIFGYHRLVYVYHDRFNNTLYMPIDADIANLTNVTLNVIPVVDGSNPNQTTLWINGSAFFRPQFSINTVPLKGGHIYLYYDQNINYFKYNPQTDPKDAQLCAFGNGASGPPIAGCINSNPVYTGEMANAHTVNYKPSSVPFTSPASCPPPPSSLLQLPSFNCNIYGNFHLPATCAAHGPAQQYCQPYANNGTGICTSQLGLIGVATTNSMGNFSFKAMACGSGFHTIIAQYYGTPPPEPILVHQPPIQVAYDPSFISSKTFTAPDYSWAPTTSTQSVAIGSLLISYGTIGGVALVASMLIILTIWMVKKGHSRWARSQRPARRRQKQ
ncbi:MAG: hypothetical protein KGH72_01215 [Candidatus Micrarchaeota archaeon]|nr:hypothetical protein [Candidatus Micrarchaeota archaeon]